MTRSETFEIENGNGTGTSETETARETASATGTATTASDGVAETIRWTESGSVSDTGTEITEIEAIAGTETGTAGMDGMDGMEGMEEMEETDETDGTKIAHVTDPVIEIETETEAETEETEETGIGIGHVTELGTEIETCPSTTPWCLWTSARCLLPQAGTSRLEATSESARSWPNARVCSHYQADQPKLTTTSCEDWWRVYPISPRTTRLLQ